MVEMIYALSLNNWVKVAFPATNHQMPFDFRDGKYWSWKLFTLSRHWSFKLFKNKIP